MENALVLLLVSTLFVLSQSHSQHHLRPHQSEGFGKPCEGYAQSEIYCYGDFLHTVQRAKLYTDQKTFVDRPLKYEPSLVLEKFKALNISGDEFDDEQRRKIGAFVDEHFDRNGTELETWEPTDWVEEPAFLQNISNPYLRQWAKELNLFWKQLGRKIKTEVRDNSSLHSMYYVSHPVIFPGGRFKEFYYWDSYWIQRGLLVSNMTMTVKGMIQNFFEMVELLGFVPNGGRIYYQRSQPPLLIPMVDSYYEATKDLNFVRENIKTMQKEFDFFMTKRTVQFSKNGRSYTLARYNNELTEPRPESYSEDFELVHPLPLNKTEEEIMYANLKTGAESGWDFSSRWFVVPENMSLVDGNLTHTKARDIIPVDLNAFLYWNAVLLKKYCDLIGNSSVCDGTVYRNIALMWKEAIHDVLWDETSGTWFDYDFVRGTPRRMFFPTNLAPLWTKAHHGEIRTIARRSHDYLLNSGATNFPGGVPTSMLHTGQQWDFPNGWAPLNHIVVEALENTGEASAQKLAFELAQKWIQSNHLAYVQTEAMFEKYDVSIVGSAGSGGEYEVVVGFGWSNGVVLDFLKKYGSRLTTVPNLPSTTTTPSSSPSTGQTGGSSQTTLKPISSTQSSASLLGIDMKSMPVEAKSRLANDESIRVHAVEHVSSKAPSAELDDKSSNFSSFIEVDNTVHENPTGDSDKGSSKPF